MHTQIRHFQLRCCALSIAALWIAADSALAVPVLLYNMDFNGPPHVIGDQPATDTGLAPRQGPSEIVFGDPRVVSSVGAMASPCLRLDDNGASTYEQLAFGLTDDYIYDRGFKEHYPAYRAEMDVILQGASLYSTPFRIFADSDRGAHALVFVPGGALLAKTLGTSGYEQQIGTYSLDRVYRVRIDTDLVQRTWRIYMDGNELFSGAYPCGLWQPYQRLFRVSLQPTTTSVVGLDNIRIYGLPEPALLAPLAFALFVLRRKRA